MTPSYFNRYENLAMERTDSGVLTVRFHTDGCPAVFTGQTHHDLARAVAEIGDDRDNKVVVLTGTFNSWNQSQLVFGREGDAWVCRIDLDPGVYQYKFIVDGNWLLDPSNPQTAEDEAGNVNNLLEVKPKP